MEDAKPIEPPKPHDPRVLLSALGGARFSGTMPAVWMSATVRGMVPIDDWALGIWARYDGGVWSNASYDPSIESGSLGLSGSRRLKAAPVEISVSIDPSVFVVAMDGGRRYHGSDDGARVGPRLGARAQLAIPFGLRWRGLVALDAELAPLEIAEEHRITPYLPPVPAYTLGASIGGELVIR